MFATTVFCRALELAARAVTDRTADHGMLDAYLRQARESARELCARRAAGRPEDPVLTSAFASAAAAWEQTAARLTESCCRERALAVARTLSGAAHPPEREPDL